MKQLILAVALAAFLAVPTLADDPPPICTQEKFAQMLAHAINSWDYAPGPDGKIQLGWSDTNDAPIYVYGIDYLTELGIAPEGGWKANEPVTQAVLEDVVEEIHIGYHASAPKRKMSVPEVLGLLTHWQIDDCIHAYRTWVVWRHEAYPNFPPTKDQMRADF